MVYAEGHGTGTKADPEELNAISDVFCGKGREEPLLIGSSKSNIGHCEPVSGMLQCYILTPKEMVFLQISNRSIHKSISSFVVRE